MQHCADCHNCIGCEAFDVQRAIGMRMVYMYSSLIVVYLYSSVVQLRARVCVCINQLKMCVVMCM